MHFVDLCVGTRPNFVKVASITNAFRMLAGQLSGLKFRLVHTGQHYDNLMSNSFFVDLNIPSPDVHLGVGSGTHAEQTGNIMVNYEKLLLQEKPAASVVVGDVNSTLACALAATKCNVKVGHVEAGLRSGDWAMPEEINRVLVDAASNWFFTTTDDATQNLIKEGKNQDHIFLVGNTVIDTLIESEKRLQQPSFWDSLGLEKKNYVVLTLHRAPNVISTKQIISTLREVCEACKHEKVVFPAHPRLKACLGAGDFASNLILVEPLRYLEFQFLVRNSLVVITDSGGITEETSFLNIPCITLRTTTERPETVLLGTNVLIGDELHRLGKLLEDVRLGNWKQGTVPTSWDGDAGKRIAKLLDGLL